MSTQQISNTVLLSSRQHTWLFSLVLNLLYTQSFISFLTSQLWLLWTWETLSWRDNLSKFSLEWTSHYDFLTWSNDSQVKNSDMQLKINFLQVTHLTAVSHSLYMILTLKIRKSMQRFSTKSTHISVWMIRSFWWIKSLQKRYDTFSRSNMSKSSQLLTDNILQTSLHTKYHQIS